MIAHLKMLLNNGFLDITFAFSIIPIYAYLHSKFFQEDHEEPETYQ